MSKIEWMSEKNILSKLKNINDDVRSEVIEIIQNRKDKPYDFNYVLKTLEQTKNWYIHEGDLILDKSFASEYALIVKGNLTIHGIYDDYKNSYIGNVIVLGNLEADHLYSWGTLTVLGDIKVKGLIYNEYNDHVFETKGEIHCKAFYVDDKQTIYNRKLLKTEFERDYDGNITGSSLVDFFVDDVINKDDEEEEFYELDSTIVKNLLYDGKDIFKT